MPTFFLFEHNDGSSSFFVDMYAVYLPTTRLYLILENRRQIALSHHGSDVLHSHTPKVLWLLYNFMKLCSISGGLGSEQLNLQLSTLY